MRLWNIIKETSTKVVRGRAFIFGSSDLMESEEEEKWWSNLVERMK